MSKPENWALPKFGCFMDGFALWTKSGLLYGKGLLYGQKVVCFMVKVCFMDKKWFALWTGPIKLGQKVVCFMDGAHKARTKIGLLYGQQITANQGKNPPSPRFGP